MAVPEETRHRLTLWCAAQVPAGHRDRRQIGYTIQGDEVTIVDRHPPTYPELDLAWTTTPLVRLRLENAPTGPWVLLRRGENSDHWIRSATGPDPISLLADLRV